MIPNNLRSRWAEGRAVLNGWLSIGSGFGAEIMAAQGYDSLTVDLQHGALDYRDMLAMFQAMRASGVVPMARVPWLEPGSIMRALDAGAYGVICPMVNSAADAARFVDCMRYPPQGQRSFGPTRARFASGGDPSVEANATVLALAMIETREALEAVEAIAATPGLDGLYIGPSDLGLSLGGGQAPARMDHEDPGIRAAIDRIRQAGQARGLRVGIHCASPDYAARMVAEGFDLVTVSGDVGLLAGAAQASVARFRALAEGGGTAAD